MNLFTKQKEAHIENKLGEGRNKLGVWDQQIHTIIYKIDKQQGPTDSTGNYIQYLVITYNGKESEREYIYIYKTESLCYISETL